MGTEVSPTTEYLQVSQEPSTYLPYSIDKHQLLILDLNGTLVSRLKTYENFYARPHHDAFFKFIFKHFHVMVWSSATERAVNAMCKIFETYEDQLRLVWNRSHFDLDQADYYKKAITYKNLEKIWAVMPEFDAKNTVILDDSVYKAGYQPHNLIHMSTFDHNQFKTDNDLAKVINYLLILKFQSNVASFMRLNPFDIQQTWGVKEDKVLDTKVTHFKQNKRVKKAKKVKAAQKVNEAQKVKEAQHIRFDDPDTGTTTENETTTFTKTNQDEYQRLMAGIERAVQELKKIEKHEQLLIHNIGQPPSEEPPLSKAVNEMLTKVKRKARLKRKSEIRKLKQAAKKKENQNTAPNQNTAAATPKPKAVKKKARKRKAKSKAAETA